jgi:hypothetical protein
MGARLYHQRYQDWNREPEIASRLERGSENDPAGGIDAVAARREEFTPARLGPLGHKLHAEIERYLEFFAPCNPDNTHTD